MCSSVSQVERLAPEHDKRYIWHGSAHQPVAHHCRLHVAPDGRWLPALRCLNRALIVLFPFHILGFAVSPRCTLTHMLIDTQTDLSSDPGLLLCLSDELLRLARSANKYKCGNVASQESGLKAKPHFIQAERRGKPLIASTIIIPAPRTHISKTRSIISSEWSFKGKQILHMILPLQVLVNVTA